ncbi:MAG: EamA family transporter [candidate division KSB1 bacterium]|nr:EamA family transporter [candidate division KSB1 bacterium]MDZ7340815.1 EamA family transporter [candidate division KSB1 bacterium]
MKPQLLALFTAIAWGVGSYFEKKGLLMGNLSPQVGITIRTFVALIILSLVSYPQWKTIPNAGPKALLYLVIGGGVLAGSVGLLLFYMAIKGAPLSRVLPIAFTSPLFGALLGFVLASEPITIKTVLGILLTVGGIVLLTVG